jgi:long-chain acyl-CoA synthetase
MISHKAIANIIIAVRTLAAGAEFVAHLSYLPFAHVFERAATAAATSVGAKIGFVSNGVNSLMEDARILKPTLFCAVPRVLTRVNEGIRQKLKDASPIARGLFWSAWHLKKFCIQHGLDTGPMDKLAFNKIKDMLGGKVAQIVCAGAALEPQIHDFLQVIFGVPIRSGYGLTEAGAGVVSGPDNLLQTIPGPVGGPFINFELRLEPVEGYNDPTCGEILAHGGGLCSGYLHDEELTKKLFLDDTHTWIRTGDLGKWEHGGYLRIVDRLRSIFKLSQGEYVAAELISQVYEECPFILQIFVYGDSGKPCLVGIVIPRKSAVAAYLGKEASGFSESDYVSACQGKQLNDAIQEQMDNVARSKGLFGFQMVRKIHLDSVEWSVENDLLTPTLKLRRKALQTKYQSEIDRMYREYVPPPSTK